jgi:hypothetical protein
MQTRFGLSVPGLEATLKALEHETGEIIVPAGAATANRLGLTAYRTIGRFSEDVDLTYDFRAMVPDFGPAGTEGLPPNR